MARCELTKKGPTAKNLVSHSNIKTKSRAHANIQSKRVFSQSLGQLFRLKIATSALKSMEHSGGFDSFILKQPKENLSKRALSLRSKIRKKLNIKGQ